jgi:predicted tellurium resistance membrane protein TerC
MLTEWVIPLITLAMLEIVLGIDNLVFLAIVTARLPEAQRPIARRYGIALACITRILLLLTLSWFAGKTSDIIWHFSIRDLVLILGGLFLLVKAAMEINNEINGVSEQAGGKAATSFGSAIAQIAVIDIVFSLDSVITAIGMVKNNVPVMVIAILCAVAVMLLASEFVARVIEENPTIKMLALAFLLIVGAVLVLDGFDYEIPRGYLYSAMAFSAAVEILNMVARRRRGLVTDGE